MNDEQPAGRATRAIDPAHDAQRLGNVLQDVEADDDIERFGGQRCCFRSMVCTVKPRSPAAERRERQQQVGDVCERDRRSPPRRRPAASLPMPEP